MPVQSDGRCGGRGFGVTLELVGAMSSRLQFFNGTGNTFYFLKLENGKPLPVQTVDELRAYARQVCSLKNRPVDGLVFYQVGLQSVEMLIVNSDGSFAGTCGNALRCLGLALLQQNAWNGRTLLNVTRLHLPFFEDDLKKLSSDEHFILKSECFATLESGDLLALPTEANVCVHMGRVKQNRTVPFQPTSLRLTSEVLTSMFVELANPHWVFVMNSNTHKWTLEECTQFGLAAQTEWASTYRVPLSNIGMLWPASTPNCLATLFVYERGAGLTQCCGSGACAAAAVLHHLHPQQCEFRFQMPGGILKVSIENGGELKLSGQVSTD